MSLPRSSQRDDVGFHAIMVGTVVLILWAAHSLVFDIASATPGRV